MTSIESNLLQEIKATFHRTMKLHRVAAGEIVSPTTKLRIKHAAASEDIVAQFIVSVARRIAWEVDSDAGHLTDVDYFVWLEEMVKRMFKLFSWDVATDVKNPEILRTYVAIDYRGTRRR
ncbi:hypothetical protein N7475_009128 [Penicillium sp. IBT 31633x]|nr:hypothetical protein N7475_009128 [Penicillium sp. IBT 31633x]